MQINYFIDSPELRDQLVPLLNEHTRPKGYQKLVTKIQIGNKQYYLKTQMNMPWHKSLRYFARFRKPLATLTYEAKTLLAIKKAGFRTIPVIAYGYDRPYFPTKSFLLTEAIQGQDLHNVVKEADTKTRLSLVEKYSSIVNKLYKNKFFQPLRFKDLIISADDGEWYILDQLNISRDTLLRFLPKLLKKRGVKKLHYRNKRNRIVMNDQELAIFNQHTQ